MVSQKSLFNAKLTNLNAVKSITFNINSREGGCSRNQVQTIGKQNIEQIMLDSLA